MQSGPSPDAARQAADFGNRLRKRDRHLRAWARREGVGAFRVYDRDIPEVPLAVDRYGDHIHIALYERPYEKPDEAERLWLDLMAETAGTALDVRHDCLHVKTRKRQRGLSQYERLDGQGSEFPVVESGLQFLVNLDNYLDTGLFLDHRPTRELVRRLSDGRRVLNLFSYTGSFSVYAAAGGAVSVESVDLSATYLAWAGRNLERNGFSGDRFPLIRNDARAFLTQARADNRTFGVIVLDPPTFSNSKRAHSDLDVNKDWPDLIRACLSVLDPNGILVFSTNSKKFRLEPAAVPAALFEDMTDRTVPPDFRGRPHRCWFIRHDAASTKSD